MKELLNLNIKKNIETLDRILTEFSQDTKLLNLLVNPHDQELLLIVPDKKSTLLELQYLTTEPVLTQVSPSNLNLSKNRITVMLDTTVVGDPQEILHTHLVKDPQIYNTYTIYISLHRTSKNPFYGLQLVDRIIEILTENHYFVKSCSHIITPENSPGYKLTISNF